MTQYLYGAKVQGIQSYIFETNKLKDIGGASELIESLSGERFADFFGSVGVAYGKNQLLRNAAGEISYLFPDKASCAAVVRNFERYIATEIPGLTVSQAVVPLEGDTPDLKSASNKVNHLLQVQRNRSGPPTELGWMISERARKTGRPGVEEVRKKDKIELIDRRQQSKRDAKSTRLYDKLIGENHGLTNKDFALDLTDITGNRERAWLAVVHADGNNLGKLIQKLLKNLALDDVQEGYRQFSETLEAATVAAAQTAYQEILAPVYEREQELYRDRDEKIKQPRLPIRPVVIGGDDLTVILRAEYAVPFTEAYLAAFERETESLFKKYAENFKVEEHFKNGLTACAGIAIIKPKYPFHYAADLAEELCSWTKKIVKNLDKESAPSSLHFHKVQASFVEDYNEIIKRELSTIDGRLLTAGPYFVNANDFGYPTVKELLVHSEILGKDDTPTGPLRDYVGELRIDHEAAKQKLERIRDLNDKATKRLGLKDNEGFHKRGKNDKASTHLYDAIQLANL
jgi:hypothetical protein